jgi:hypothetical protein
MVHFSTMCRLADTTLQLSGSPQQKREARRLSETMRYICRSISHSFCLLAALLCCCSVAFTQVAYFDQIQPLSSGTVPKGYSRAVVSGRAVYVVWNAQVGAQGGTNVLFSRSFDLGATFEGVRNLSGFSSPDSDYPRIAVDGNKIYVVWIDYVLNSSGVANREVMLSSSNDGGGSFGTPFNVSNEPNCDSMNADVAASNGKVYVAWEEYACSNAGVYLATGSSQDGFTTNQVPTPISANMYTPVVAAADNVVYVVSNPLIGNKRGIHYSRSLDDGATFDLAGILSLPGAAAAEQLMPSVAASGDRVYVAWEELGTSLYDVYVAMGSKQGAQLTIQRAPNYHGEGSFPSVSATAGQASVAWFDGKGHLWYWMLADPVQAGIAPAMVYSTTAGQSGAVSVAASESGVFATWSEISPSGSWDIMAASSLDSDGDGLPDDWEINGVPVNGKRVKLPCTPDPDTGADVCPDPQHKDIYLEVDYMQYHKPHTAAINDVVRAFKNSSAKNPDGMPGINLHVIVDEEIPHQNVVHVWNEFDSIKAANFGTAAERASADWAAIKAAKQVSFHYALFAHQFSEDPADTIGRANSGLARIGGSDLLVTLGGSGFGETVVSLGGGLFGIHTVGTRDEQASTFMHELGHNLGLGHGGGDHVNCKPNYLSIMSYSRNLPIYIANRPMDYSRGQLDDLDESRLSERYPMTVGGALVPGLDPNSGLATVWRGGGHRNWGFVGYEMDWNGNGVIDPGFFAEDVNALGACQMPDSTGVMRGDGIGVLSGFDDWASLRYAFRATGPEAPGAPIIEEVTAADALMMHLENLEALDHRIQILPPEAYDSPATALQHLTDLHASLMLNPASVSAYIKNHEFANAGAVLRSVRGRVDGTGSDDWITDPATQQRLLMEIDNMLLAFDKSADYGGDAPVANAGPDQSVEEGSAVKLNGLQSYDPDGQDLSYAWQQIGGPLVILSGASSAIPTFTAPPVYATSVLTFQLVVSAGTRISSNSIVNVTDHKHVNEAPVAVVGGNRTVQENTLVVLDGSNSYDPEGAPLTYAWTQTAGPAVTLSDATSASPFFIAPPVTTDTRLDFQLCVSDGQFTSAPATVSITVHHVIPAPLTAPPLQLGQFVSSGYGDSAIALAASGNSVYALWSSYYGSIATLSFRASQDGGQNFADPVIMSSSSGNSGWLAASGDNVYVTWLDSSLKLFVAGSTDRGRTFTAPVLISNFAWAAEGLRPKLSASGNTAYIAYSPDNTNAKTVRFRVSRDAGRTFEPELTLGTMPYPWGNFDLAAENGRVYASWYGGGTGACLLMGTAAYTDVENIWVTVSHDDGRTFQPAVPAVQKTVQRQYFSGWYMYCGIKLDRLFVHNGAVQVWWEDFAFVNQLLDQSLHVTSSVDDGQMFGASATVINSLDSSNFNAQIAAAPDPVYVVSGNRSTCGGTCNISNAELQISSDNFAGVKELTSPDFASVSGASRAVVAADGDVSYILWQRGTGSGYHYWLYASYDRGVTYASPADVMLEDINPMKAQLVANGNQFYILLSDSGKNLYFVRGTSGVPAAGNDTTPPVIVPTVTPAPNAGGWHNSDVTVSWAISDADSGISSSVGCGTTTVTANTPALTITCTAYNGQGGSASRSVVIRLDKTPPTITGFRVTRANASGWNTTDVEVTFQCADDQSALVTCGPSPMLVSSEGAGQSVTGTATDMAGNTASFTVSNINIDKTVPTVLASTSPAPNANGWNNANVIVSFNGTEPVSGIDSCSSPVTLSTEGAGQSASGTCTDKAGNVSAPATARINIDKTPPQLIFGTQSPAANAAGWNNANVSFSFTPSDGLSGVDTVSSPNPLVLTAEGSAVVGTMTVTDKAGNSATFITPAAKIDKTAPTITATRMPPPNVNGWNNSAVTVNFQCSDALSGLAVGSPPPPTILSGDGAAQAISGSCTDVVGNVASAAVQDINIDRTAPALNLPADQTVLQSITTGAVVNYPAPVGVETGSGLASLSCLPASGSLFPLGSTEVKCTATDVAGNASTGSFNVTVTAATTSDGLMSGFGFIQQANVHHHFLFRVSQLRNQHYGRLEYWTNDPRRCGYDDLDRGVRGDRDDEYRRDHHNPRSRFEATSMSVAFSDDPRFQPGPGSAVAVDSVRLSGSGRWNGRAGYTFEATATDRGELGRGRDTFAITIKDSRGSVVASVDGTLAGGNIQSTLVR